ncbi:MAG TPA: OmpA family protein [Syntrophorhabdaceae bacterium]|nr:OmpA family protein [Syntrophorhabdaceae bacterium]
MNKLVIFLAVLSVFALLVGCAARSTVVLIPDPDGNVGQVIVANEQGQQVLNEANQSVIVAGRNAAPGAVKTMTTDEIRSVFSDALAARPLPPARFILYFLMDSDELTRESKAVVPEVLATIRKRSSVDIVISGHTDTVGTNDYNYRLGLDRTKAIYDILVAKGVAASSITATSHGEGNPLIKTGDNIPEPRNRRVEIAVK